MDKENSKKDKMNIVCIRIKQRRQELGLTQTDLANRLGLKSKVSICDVERGRMDLTTERVRAFAEALECTPAELMGWSIDNENFEKRMMIYMSKLQEAFMKAPEKDKKVVCTILDLPYEELL